MTREYELTLFGATGFTGQLVAEYLSRHAPFAFRWAIAGRDSAKLNALKNRFEGALRPPVAAVVADTRDPASLRALARQTQVILNTTGPFIEHGLPVVAAAIEAGTHHLDLSGEPDYVAQLIERYHLAARDKGVRIVPCCGFDSVPFDLGVQFTVGELPHDREITVEGIIRAHAGFSGGTWLSAIRSMKTAGPREKRSSENGSMLRPVEAAPARVHYVPEVGLYACPLPTIDGSIVRRSARHLPGYGTRFSYGHFAGFKRLRDMVVGVSAVGSLFMLTKLPKAEWLLSKVKPSGAGPSPEERTRSWFRARFVGRAGDQTVVTEVKGGDPGYDETSKMLSEAGILLARDEAMLPRANGVLTPAVALGAPYRERLIAAGISFTVLERTGVRRSDTPPAKTEPRESPRP